MIFHNMFHKYPSSSIHAKIICSVLRSYVSAFTINMCALCNNIYMLCTKIYTLHRCWVSHGYFFTQRSLNIIYNKNFYRLESLWKTNEHIGNTLYNSYIIHFNFLNFITTKALSKQMNTLKHSTHTSFNLYHQPKTNIKEYIVYILKQITFRLH